MIRHTTAILYREDPSPRGVFDRPVRQERKVFCTVRSVGMRESYEAMSHGLRPELVITLAQAFEYQGEGGVILDGTDYTVLRTYVTTEDGIELTLQRKEDVG